MEMSYLLWVETVVRNVVRKLEVLPMTSNSDVEDCWAEFSVGSLEFVGKWQEAQSVGETLTKLLMDSDRRVVVLSMLYLGMMRKWLDDVNGAIDRINDIANRSDDKTIGIATGTANAMLGYAPAIRWATDQKQRTKSSSVEALYKNSQLVVVVEIAQGWK
jgi:hypothetical protein